MKYRISDFCHFVDLDKFTIALYNSLTLGIIFVNKRIADFLKNAVGGVIEKETLDKLSPGLDGLLLERRLIYPLGERHDLQDYLALQQYLKRNNFAIMYLLATDLCNLGCKYCYVESKIPKDYKHTMMEIETADMAFDLFLKSLPVDVSEPIIILYGGEPLLNMPLVKYTIDRFETLRKTDNRFSKSVLTINTNGTLIDDDFLNLLKNKMVNLAISLDGKKESHDKMRVYKDGRGSFEVVMKSCEKLQQSGISFGFSITITNANIFSLEDILIWLHDKFNLNAIGFNIAIYRPNDIIGMNYEEYGKLVTDKLINCFKLCRQLGIYEDRVMRKVESFVNGDVYAYDCGGQGNQMVVSPDGQVGICAAYCGSKEYFVPMTELDIVTDHEIWQTWQYRSPLYQKQCYHCIALGTCGGGCAYSAELMGNTIWGLDSVFCYYSKEMILFLIRELYEKTICS